MPKPLAVVLAENKDNLENAGATWIDEPCVVDGKMVSAQVPKDLPDFMAAILKLASQ